MPTFPRIKGCGFGCLNAAAINLVGTYTEKACHVHTNPLQLIICLAAPLFSFTKFVEDRCVFVWVGVGVGGAESARAFRGEGAMLLSRVVLADAGMK
eukprot:1160206-Pelagomonas_calceolata.AAC.7